MRKFVSIFLATSLVAGSAFAQTTNIYTKDGAPVETAAPAAQPVAAAPAPDYSSVPAATPHAHKAPVKHTTKTTAHKKKTTTHKKKATHKKKKTAHKKKATHHKKATHKKAASHHVKKTASSQPAPMAAPVAYPEQTAPAAPMAPATGQ